jgi:hypothetical protein
VRERKLMSAIKGRTWAEDVRELGPEQDIEIKGLRGRK